MDSHYPRRVSGDGAKFIAPDIPVSFDSSEVRRT
jgi:hypothetical protein